MLTLTCCVQQLGVGMEPFVTIGQELRVCKCTVLMWHKKIQQGIKVYKPSPRCQNQVIY